MDRSRAEFSNAKAVVLSVETNGTYKLGTKHGILKSHYTRNQFTVCAEEFVSIDDVSMEKDITLREVARLDSVGTGQGFFKCLCSLKCESNRCKCKKNAVKCNSRCKCSVFCRNK